MSTRCTTHFQYQGRTQAIVYRHSDGYPEGHGVDLFAFFADVQANVPDTRCSDPTYLAAKLVVWLAAAFVKRYDPATYGPLRITEERFLALYGPPHPLNFLSVGVCMEDPGDIDYRYLVHCHDLDPQGFPQVTCVAVRTGLLVPIPRDDKSS